MKDNELCVWVVRDYNGELSIFSEFDKPYKHDEYFYWDSDDRMFFSVDFDLPHVKWEDDEATKIKLEVVADE